MAPILERGSGSSLGHYRFQLLVAVRRTQGIANGPQRVSRAMVQSDKKGLR
jgi:hypothetical protein